MSGVAAIMLALFEALKAPQPRMIAEVRKDVKALVNRARSLHRALSPNRVMADTASAVWCNFTSTELPDGSVELSWADPVAEFETALEFFVERASQAHLPTHKGGTRPSTTTLAAIGLVGLAIEHRPDISAAPLARLAARLLDPVIGELDSRHSIKVGTPDWHDRVSADLAERHAQKSASAKK